jgi:hypothetical protein
VPANLVNLFKERFSENGGFAKELHGIWPSCEAVGIDDAIIEV